MNQSAQIKNMITDLRNAINDWDKGLRRARDLILELARIINESGSLKTDEICGAIKIYLKDEIEKKKITAKWIEEVLPKEYKRKYTKSEPTSLLKPEKIRVTTTGQHIVCENDSYKLESNDNDVYEDKQGSIELKEDLPKPTTCLDKPEQEHIFEVFKEKLEEIIGCLKKCERKCYLIFNDRGILITIEPDL
ncbi:MAG: hypothetical protein ABJB85_06800 [Nitrososphaerota archaeon]